MASTEIKTKNIAFDIFGRHGWQLSDESDEDEGIVLPGGDDDEKEEADLSDEESEEEE